MRFEIEENPILKLKPFKLLCIAQWAIQRYVCVMWTQSDRTKRKRQSQYKIANHMLGETCNVSDLYYCLLN